MLHPFLFPIATKVLTNKHFSLSVFHLRVKKDLMEKEENLASKAYL